jgi:hypothetical protein
VGFGQFVLFFLVERMEVFGLGFRRERERERERGEREREKP